jgi:phenylacetate-coenzyme A ligase PaaK-like adenylate-forming protein
MRDLRIHDARYELATPDAIAALQLRRLRESLRFAAATNDFYRDRWDAAGVDVNRIDSIERFAATVPMVEKRDFVEDQLAHPPFGKRLARSFALAERLEVYTTSGRTDDVKKVKGVSIHPQAVDDVLFSFGEVDEYQVVLSSDARMADVATVEVMTKSPPRVSLVDAVAESLRERVGIHFPVTIVSALPRSEDKARRRRDERVR